MRKTKQMIKGIATTALVLVMTTLMSFKGDKDKANLDVRKTAYTANFAPYLSSQSAYFAKFSNMALTIEAGDEETTVDGENTTNSLKVKIAGAPDNVDGMEFLYNIY